MNPETLKFESLSEGPLDQLIRPNGTPVPSHWAVFTVDELVVIKGHTFKVVYIGEGCIMFEPAPLALSTAQTKL